MRLAEHVEGEALAAFDDAVGAAVGLDADDNKRRRERGLRYPVNRRCCDVAFAVIGGQHVDAVGDHAKRGLLCVVIHDEPVELVSLEVVGRGIPAVPRAASAAAASLAPDIAIAAPTRRAYFGPRQGWREARVINRSTLATPHPGPCIVEEYDATCLVPPGWTARLDEFGNIVLSLV